MNQLPVWVWTILFDWMRAFIKIQILDFVYVSKEREKKKQQSVHQTKRQKDREKKVLFILPEGKLRNEKKSP